jgi:HAD superfamily hydrolase (TIGR01662 family)
MTHAALAPLVRSRISRRTTAKELPDPQSGSADPGHVLRPAVLFDRDDTLIDDVPYNGEPSTVVLRTGANAAVDRLRRAGFLLGMVSNQSGVARGLIATDDVDRVNRRVEELIGPLDVVVVCPHGQIDGCPCRKPAPGMVLVAAAVLGVTPDRCVVVGDIGADVEAATAAGARAILIPTLRTRPEECREAARVAEVVPDLASAVDRIMSWYRSLSGREG